MFTKIQPRKVSDDIVDQFVSAIFTGKLAPGSKLPPERSLSQSFGVGRNAVREALQKLQGMGLVRTRKPQGTFVCFLTPEAIRQPMVHLLTQEISGVTNFLDVRKWLEGMSAAETAEKGTEDDIRRIRETLPALQLAGRRNDREALDASDVAFHVAIVAGTHNPTVIHLLDVFRNLMWSSHGFRTVILEAADFKAVCEEHRAIAEAIEARTPERAREAMMHHIEMIRARVERMYRRPLPSAAGAAAETDLRPPRRHPRVARIRGSAPPGPR